MNTLLPSILQNAVREHSTIQKIVADLKKDSLPKEIEGLKGALHAYFIAEYIEHHKKSVVIVVSNEAEVQSFLSDFEGIYASVPKELCPQILTLPWWGMLPYRAAAKHSVVFGQRAGTLAKMAVTSLDKPSIFIIPQRAFQTPLPNPDYIKTLLFSVSCNQNFDPHKLAEHLSVHGYVRVPRVTVRGEFALRGEVLDVFMPDEEFAHRIIFEYDTIESIRIFNPETQSSVGEIENLLLYPMKEVIWTDEIISSLETALKRRPAIFSEEAIDIILSDLHIKREFDGEELFYGLAFEDETKEKFSIINYLEDTTLFFIDYDRLDNAQESFDREFLGMYRKECHERSIPEPQDILLNFRSITESYNQTVLCRTIHGSNSSDRLHIECDPPRSFFGNINFLKEELEQLHANGWKTIVFADSENQSLRIKEILPDVIVLPFPLSSGFGLPDSKILVIQENEIFGRRKHVPRSVKHAKSAVIDTFVELNPGDYVVHVNYGIGLFKGIERMKVMGNERDYIKLLYAEDQTVFIPIEQVNLVQRYIGNEGEAPRLDKIGSKSWENRKNKVKKSVEDIAMRLIELYSKRKAARGFAFPKDSEWQTAFEAAFPYQETDDQITVISEIKEDMEKPVPMDRLVCGDVGYGKTEVALRAAFKAIMGGKQVALLAPTTILAEQHYDTAVERFENFPVRIAQLSRFITPAEQKKTLEKLKKGEIDFIIGTHRLIQKDVQFKDVGLLVIDEEQRFGVKDKERLKELKNSVDSLAMSATPIPRTLHMSLLKIRDMSLLATPPHNRYPIETVIDSFNDDRVAAAIRRETERGGQVFYLHNRVESLHETKLKLESLVPEMLIDVAHGQMSASQLEDIFRRFKMGGFHVLVATTIIENGIDIPNVNTIIIDRADMYGVSQLYQLRGRVGRSDRKAYAYLFYPENRALSEVAMKRLQVISDFTELGSGFKIAMKDMEIRGAGNLLGRDQSGDVYSVGFDLYLRLLEDAVQRLSDSNYESEQEPLLELDYTGFIPDTYIQNQQIKMEIYKKIASVFDSDELDRVYAELSDRFGPMPDEVESLLSLAEIRILCRILHISSLKERRGSVLVEFSKVSDISVDKVLRLISESAGKVKLDPKQANLLVLQVGSIGLKEKSSFIRERLESLKI